MRKASRFLTIFLLVALVGPLLTVFSGAYSFTTDWRTASRESIGIAPDPESNTGAVVQVYAARAFNWRGVFAVHSWIAVKPKNAREYTVYQVLGWNLLRGKSTIDSTKSLPDRKWYGAEPKLIADYRDKEAEKLIPQIVQSINEYPYAFDYTLWPGPNSNTFVAHVLREVGGLEVALPVTAIGKDYLGPVRFLARAPSGTGWQFSLGGYFGLTLASREGLEINVLGAVLGVDFLRPAIKLPGLGRLGLSAVPRQFGDIDGPA